MTDPELADLASIISDEASGAVVLRVAAATLLAEVRRVRGDTTTASTARVATSPTGKRLGFRA